MYCWGGHSRVRRPVCHPVRHPVRHAVRQRRRPPDATWRVPETRGGAAGAALAARDGSCTARAQRRRVPLAAAGAAPGGGARPCWRFAAARGSAAAARGSAAAARGGAAAARGGARAGTGQRRAHAAWRAEETLLSAGDRAEGGGQLDLRMTYLGQWCI